MNKFTIPAPVAALAFFILISTAFGYGSKESSKPEKRQITVEVSGIDDVNAKYQNISFLSAAKKSIDISSKNPFPKEYCETLALKASKGVKVSIVYDKVPGWSKETPDINCAYSLNEAGAKQYVANKGIIIDDLAVFDGKTILTNALQPKEDSNENPDKISIAIGDEKSAIKLQRHIHSLFDLSKRFEGTKKK